MCSILRFFSVTTNIGLVAYITGLKKSRCLSHSCLSQCAPRVFPNARIFFFGAPGFPDNNPNPFRPDQAKRLQIKAIERWCASWSHTK